MQSQSPIKIANQLFRDKNYAGAIPLYLRAMQETPELAHTFAPSAVLARKRYQSERRDQKPAVLVCGWELSHNAAGRVHTLVQLYETFADVGIIGTHFPNWGRELWPPLRGTRFSIHSFVAEDQSRFIAQALELVLAHPCDILHLSKPRLPNILFGLLYKLAWGAVVLMDIDDEELAFVNAREPLSLPQLLQKHGKLPEFKAIAGPDWTRIAVGLAGAFDGVTVANAPLQERYGGEIVRHARDEKLFQPSPELRQKARKTFGIGEDKKVVLFFGTPRPHKGLLETARALAALGRKDVVFAVVGDFHHPELKKELEAIKGLNLVLAPDQPVERIPQVAVLGDVCVLLQDPEGPVARFQTPAKLSDALGMGLALVVQGGPALADVCAGEAVVSVTPQTLQSTLADLLDRPERAGTLSAAARDLFLKEFSFAANAPGLRKAVEDARAASHKAMQEADLKKVLPAALIPLAAGLEPLFPLLPLVGRPVKAVPVPKAQPPKAQPSESVPPPAPASAARGVSAVILTLDGAKHLDRLLDTFFAVNTHRPVELIVVDHGSADDGTAQVIARHASKGDIRHIRRDKNYTFSQSCNFGAAQAKYPHLLFLNNDIIYTSDAIPPALARLDQDPNTGAVGIRLDDDPASLPPGKEPGVQHTGIHFAWNEKRGYHQPEQTRHPSLKDFLASGSRSADSTPPAVTAAFMMVRKGDFDALDGFSEEYEYGLEDVDFCLRLGRDLGKECWCLHDVGLQHVEGATRFKGDRTVRGEVLEKNHEVFKGKWGGYVRDIFIQAKQAKSITKSSLVPTSSQGKKIAVVLHAYYEKLLPEIFKKLGNLENDYDLFVTIPENVVDVITPAINKFTQNWTSRVVSNIGYDILPFWNLIPELYESGYEYVCKIHTKSDHPDFGPLWRECLLDGVLGEKPLVREIVGAFENDTSLHLVGPALLYMPVLGSIYDGREKLSKLLSMLFKPQEQPEDWGFFGGTMFWARLSELSKLTKHLSLEGIEFEAPKSGVRMGWTHILERIFGILTLWTRGKVALVDYRLRGLDAVPKLRVIDNYIPKSLPSKYRLKTFKLLKKGMLAKHELLLRSNILDPYYYLEKHPLLINQQYDCIEHYLNNSEQNFLNKQHEHDQLRFHFVDNLIKIQTGNDDKQLSLDDTFASDIAGWKPLPNKNRQPNPKIKVSVICITYNHEPFIAQALEGFLAQKTNFQFEVIIGDDCSTDRTADIIQEYADKYPDIFVFVRRTQNLGVRGNARDLRRRIRGQYVALNEGDDYWTDPHKLQLQADFLDAHPECSLCYHPVLILNNDNPSFSDYYPRNIPTLSGLRSSVETLLTRNFIQTNSVMYRWQFHEIEDDGYFTDLQPGDWYGHILHALHGEIHMIERVMGVYRKHSGGVWSIYKDHLSRMKAVGNEHMQFYRVLNSKLSNRFHIDLLNPMKNMFQTLASSYFNDYDIINFYQLIEKNRDIAPIALYFLKMNININHINEPADLEKGFKKIFKISTIITSYDHEKYIEQCLQSVVIQKGFFDHEIIIADDFSTDDTPVIIAKFQEKYPELIRVLPSEKNLGMLQNMKKALQACTGNFIAFCEGDDYWLSEFKLHKQLSFLLQNKELPMCFNWLLLYNEDDKKFYPHPQQGAITKDRITFDDMLPVDLPANFSCCLYRREAMELVPEKYFQEKRAADWLFNMCIASTADLGFMKDILSVYRINAHGQWSGLSDNEKRERMQDSYKKFLDYFPDNRSSISKFIVNSNYITKCNALPTKLSSVKTDNIRFHIQSIKIIFNMLDISGWLVHFDLDSHQDELKYILFTDDKLSICYKHLLQNVSRPDVAKTFEDKFSTSVKVKNFCGFKGMLSPSLVDGCYQIYLGKCVQDNFVYTNTQKSLCVTNGLLNFA